MGYVTAETTERQWPFSRSELMAGLRRYLAASSLRLLDIQPIPLPSTMPGGWRSDSGTKLSGLSVGVRIEGEEQSLPLVLKEPPITDGGRVLTAVGQREYGVYRRLAPHLPVLVPGLVAGDENQGWIVLEVLMGLRPAPDWLYEDYEEAIINLVTMHDRFWGLSEDLSTFAWLARPLDIDYRMTVLRAVRAVEALAMEERLPLLNDLRYFDLFGLLTRSADEIIAPLRAETATLIHGDYWPGNIARPIDGRQIVFDWQLAGIGPSILDLACFVQSTRLYLEPAMPPEAMISLYRSRCQALINPGWSASHFNLLWDHALMWVFLSRWLVKLASTPPDLYESLHARFSVVWLEPLFEIAAHRLNP